MKKLLLILLLISFTSCAVDDCVVITRKENTGVNFLFFFEDDRNPFVNNENIVDCNISNFFKNNYNFK